MNKYDSCPECTRDKDVSSTSAVLQTEKRLHIQFTPSNPKFGGEKAVEARERFVSQGNTSAYATAAQGKRTKKMLTGFAYKMMHLTFIQKNL